MADFSAAIRKSQDAIARAQTRISAITTRAPGSRRAAPSPTSKPPRGTTFTNTERLNARHNALLQDEQVHMAKSRTLERHIEKGRTWVGSPTNQTASQLVPINSLQTDTKQRVVLHDALVKSLKTAQQQDVARRINEIDVQTDTEA